VFIYDLNSHQVVAHFLVDDFDRYTIL